MSEVCREAQEEEVEATIALLLLPSPVLLVCAQFSQGTNTQSRKQGDPLFLSLLRSVCMREIKLSLCQEDAINSGNRHIAFDRGNYFGNTWKG